MASTLTHADIRSAAKLLGVEPATIRAVDEVESRGDGFLDSGKVKVLFERHKFHKFTGGRFSKEHPDISNPRSGGYGAEGEHQYARFSKAFQLDPKAAMKSCSWGRYQIMGFNHAAAGFPTVDAFVDAMKVSEGEQLKAFVNIIKSWDLADELRRHDWSAFAAQYNGPAYKKNRYDSKMEAAYKRFKTNPFPEDVEFEKTQAEEKIEKPPVPTEPKVPVEPTPAPAQTIPAIPPLPVNVPDWAKKLVKWGAGLNLGSLAASFAVLRDNPAALVAVLNILKWGFIALGVVIIVVALGVFISSMYNKWLANKLNIERLRNYADPSTDNIDFSGWKAAPDKSEVKL